MAAKKRTSAGSKAEKIVRQKLESLARAGVTHLKKPKVAKARPKTTATAKPVARPAARPTAGPASPATRPAASPAAARRPSLPPVGERALRPKSATGKAGALEVIQREVAACTRCHELAATRTQTVFGVGNANARLVLMGEAPGADEDLQGEPFVGRSGQLLTKIIEACNLTRDDVYILNTIKCRPPGNRPPAPTEVSNCRGYFERQIDVIQPEYICCLGTSAAQSLLQVDTTIGKLRGKLHDYRGIQVMCTYHPSYLLRNPAAKKDVWEDMQFLMKAMGIKIK
jgi:DNA polymerase